MARPNLIHPIPVTIEPFNTAMVKDDDARETLHAARGGTPFTVSAQIRWQSKDVPNFQRGGPRENSSGYILVRTEDLQNAGVVLKRGDKITNLGTGPNMLSGVYFLMGCEPLGHYPDQQGASLLKWYFADRHPGK